MKFVRVKDEKIEAESEQIVVYLLKSHFNVKAATKTRGEWYYFARGD